MRATSILLAMIVVLSAREAFAVTYHTNPDLTYRVSFFGMTFGFNHLEPVIPDPLIAPYTLMSVRPLGHYEVPFTTKQGLVGIFLILATLIIVSVVLTVRWKKKRVVP